MRKFLGLFSGWLAAGLISASEAAEPGPFDYTSFFRSVDIPAGWTLELAAGAPAFRFPMFACFDDSGRLYVTESSGNNLYAGLQNLTRDCRVLCLEDRDGDGRYETTISFQDGVTFPMGLAWHRGKLYVADPPDLVALTDTDGDGRADQREVVLTGFGHTDNGSLHGLTFGPDGRLYFTMGEPDGWKFTRPDGSVLQGVAGALFRVKPDGSEVEVISRGFVNLVEVEFWPGGEMVGTDNWYQTPTGGNRDALVDCAPGGLYPYAPDRGTPLPRTGLTLPPLILMPAVAHSGIARPRANVGLAGWRDSVLVAEHNTRKVVRHELRREGSTFASRVEDFVVGKHPDFHPSDVLEDADGSWLMVDTGGWYVEHCPTGRIRDSRAPGGIYRVRWTNAAKLSDPRGKLIRWDEANVAEVATRLRDPRPAVAERAADELILRSDVTELAGALAIQEPLDTRLRAIWSLARMPELSALVKLREQLSSPDPVVVAATARVLALRRDRESGERLAALLESSHAFVRRAAAEALSRCGSKSQAPGLVTALTRASDLFEQHACLAALLEIADEPLAREMLAHGSPRVRQAALHCLDQPRIASLDFVDVLGSLNDPNSELSAGAHRLLERHPEWAEEVGTWLREQLRAGQFDHDRMGALEQILIHYQKDPKVRAAITEQFDLEESTPGSMRGPLLRLLASLNDQPPEPAWLRAISAGLADPKLRSAALTAAAAYPRAMFRPVLVKLAEDEQATIADRLLAARLSDDQTQLSEPVFTIALASLHNHARAEDRLSAADLLAKSKFTAVQSAQILATLRQGAPVPIETLLPALARSADATSRPALAEYLMERLGAGWSPSRATLDQALNAFADDPANRERIQHAWNAHRADAMQRIQEFTLLLTGGDRDHGRAVFELATCSGCHPVDGRGGTIGPDLTKIGLIRSGSDLLESILYPSSSFAQGYEPYVLVRRNGDEIVGSFLARDADAVRIRDTAGLVHRVRSDDIQSLERQSMSAMPEGLEQLITREQFRDLMAYLQSLK